MAASSAVGSGPITPLLGGSRPATPTAVIISSYTSGAESQAGDPAGANGGGEINVDVARGSHLNVEHSPLLTGASISAKSSTCNGSGNGECSRASDVEANPTTHADSSGYDSASPGNAAVRFLRSVRYRCAQLFIELSLSVSFVCVNVYGPFCLINSLKLLFFSVANSRHFSISHSSSNQNILTNIPFE